MNVPQRLVEAIEQSPSIIVTTHVQPDGDAIGSMLGLKHALESAGKMVIAVLPDEVPANLRFLPGADEIMAGDCAAAAGQHALAVVLDCGSLDRVGRCAGAVQASGLMANVDHHPTNTGFADINWVDVAAASTSEMVFGLLERMGIALGPETATCLLAGVITDTGSFRYSNTTAYTFRVAAALTEAGASPWQISQSVYDTRSYQSLAGMAEAILSMEFHCSGLMASMDITADLMRRYSLTESETEGFISYARSVAGVEVAVVYKEIGSDEIRVGLRSNRDVDVSRIALALGGGGHVRASGLTFRGGLEQAKAAVMAEVRKALREAGHQWTD